MCIPPLDADPAPHFTLLRELAQRHNLASLSMGMSSDFETAVQLGATHVRIGTAIFGAREHGGQSNPTRGWGAEGVGAFDARPPRLRTELGATTAAPRASFRVRKLFSESPAGQ